VFIGFFAGRVTQPGEVSRAVDLEGKSSLPPGSVPVFPLAPGASGAPLLRVKEALLTSSRRRSHPRPEPIREPNRCTLEPLKPRTPKTALYLVLPQAYLTLQVVCPGLAHFRLPVRSPKSPSLADANAGLCDGLFRSQPPSGSCLLDMPALLVHVKHQRRIGAPLNMNHAMG
jgi:hypothetical protein